MSLAGAPGHPDVVDEVLNVRRRRGRCRRNETGHPEVQQHPDRPDSLQFVLHKLCRGGPLLLRHDTATGEGWGLRGLPQAKPVWAPIREANAVRDAEDRQPPGD